MDTSQHQIETPGEAGKFFLLMIPVLCCVASLSPFAVYKLVMKADHRLCLQWRGLPTSPATSLFLSSLHWPPIPSSLLT